MKAEYDFSQGERGKFYHPEAVFHLPVYLEPDVNKFMSQLADEKGLEVQKLVNSWLRHSITLIQSLQTSASAPSSA